MDSTIRFIKAFPWALEAMPADPTALGTIPAAAMRYCEALRSASSFGWYAFPAKTITLQFDGTDTYMLHHGDAWEILETEHAAEPDEWWNRYCPESLANMAPPFVTAIGNPGFIQIWSGLLVQTKKNWSSLIRPIANTAQSGQYSCFEGIVETDRYGPAPLFINLRLLSTGTPITINANEPLFQVQPIHRSCYSSDTVNSYSHDDPQEMSTTDWSGYQETIRSTNPTDDDHQLGQYAVSTRKRMKNALVSL